MKTLRELAVNYAAQLGVTPDELQSGLERAQGMWFEKEII
jgi:hypothetical protein